VTGVWIVVNKGAEVGSDAVVEGCALGSEVGGWLAMVFGLHTTQGDRILKVAIEGHLRDQ